MTDTTVATDSTTPAQPKPPALYGLDVPYTGPVKVIAGPGLEAAVRVIKGAGQEGITSLNLAETLNILGSSADNYLRKLGLIGLVSKRQLPHAGKGAPQMAYAWIPGRDIDLISQEDHWSQTAAQTLAKKAEKRKASVQARQALTAARVEFNRTQGAVVAKLKEEAKAKVKAAKDAAKAEMDAAIKAIVAKNAGQAPAPAPAEAPTAPVQPPAPPAEAAPVQPPAPPAAPKGKPLPPKRGK